MNHNTSYLIDVIFVGLSLFAIVYIIYGRIKNQALIGGYKPGVPGYDVFKKLISTKALIIVCLVAVCSAIGTVLDIFSILESNSPHSILIAAPIAVIVAMVITFTVLPTLIKK